jgi:o-succinylbenzoate---CoA ligase
VPSADTFGPGAGSLTAVDLPAPAAADAIRRAWDEGRAVLPLDQRAPEPERARLMAEARPTHREDATGVRALAGGEPVAPEVAAVVATSGTTGDPRAVELTWDGLRAAVAGTARALGVEDGDRWLGCLPVHGVGGLAVIARAWAGGMSAELVSRFDAEVLVTTDATLTSLVPTLLARALDAGVDLGRFRRILVGGAPLGGDLRHRAEAAGAPVVDSYGLSETWGGVVYDGQPLAGVEVCLSEDHEILVRGAVVMRGYRLRPGETAAVLAPDGWLHTGDVGAWAGDGTLRVVDRRRDLVVSGGVSVSPTEVEGVLRRHPGVADVAVAGATDPDWGERVVAHVVPEDPARPPTLAELRAFAAEHLSPAKLPRQVVLIDSVPRTPGGKIRRRLLGV